jgi:hypothetical protein
MSDDYKILAAFITGGFALVGVIYSAVINYISRIKQNRFKVATDRQLVILTDNLQTERDERLKHLESSLKKIERLEASRSAGYEEIWTLTGSLNLFGPTIYPDNEDLSTRLKDWYFNHGLLFKKESESKRLYFLVQEVLNFAIFRSVSFKRPSPDKLFGKKERPVQVLDNLRLKYLGTSDNGGNVAKLESSVTKWKLINNERKEQDEENWILLQLLLSRFRSSLIKDLDLS